MNRVIRNNQDFGSIVRSARKHKKFRQVDVARLASVRQALISDIENGVTSANLNTIIHVLAALDLDLAIVNRRQSDFDPSVY